MRLIIAVILIIVMGIVTTKFFPWWIAVVNCFVIVGYFNNSFRTALISGAVGFGLFWALLAIYKYQINDGLLAGKVAELFHFPNGLFLIVITTMLGILLGSLSGISGYLFFDMLQLKKKQNKYR